MKAVLIVIVLLLTPFLFPVDSFAAGCPKGESSDPCKGKDNPTEKVACYTDVVNACATERQNLAGQVAYLSSKIELTMSKIESNKKKITSLESEIEKISGKLDNLENTLTDTIEKFLERTKKSYMLSNIPSYNIFFSEGGFSGLVNRYKYVQSVQNHNKRLMVQLQNSKVNFEEQKANKEDKKKELANLKAQLEKDEKVLASQRTEKEIFLRETKNSESVYKQNLAAAQKEAQEIQQAASILSEAGVSKRVSRGDAIGIMGNTGFSTGAHLHFAVYDLKESDMKKFNFEVGYDNPLNYLSSASREFVSNSCDDVGSTITKTVGSGSWEWPMANPKITQCYGHTPFSAAYYRSGIHNGIDMFNISNTIIRAAESGNAFTYRGGQAKGNGVFIFHDNGKMTLYWHLQ